MNPTVLVQHASFLNAEGVQALTVGSGTVAHQKFRQALEIMSHATQLSLQQQPHDHMIMMPNSSSWHKNALSCCPIPGFEDSNFYVCNNALLFSVQVQPGSAEEMDATAIAVCCHATMFNMALTLHQRGVMTGSQRNLVSASRLYEQCLRLNVDLVGPTNEVNILAMASLNNVSQIYYDLGDYDKAVTYLQSVRSLVSETDCTLTSAGAGLASILKFDDVILNVLVTRKPDTAPCA